MAIFLDSFSGALADLPKVQRGTIDALRVLELHPRVSAFDRSELRWLDDLLRDLLNQRLIVEIAAAYPWYRYELMTAGRQILLGSKTLNVVVSGSEAVCST